MTTVILVIVGILLAAAAAIMLVYYGGNSSEEAAIKAQAARLVNDGAQITYAMDLFQKQEGYIPGNGTDGEAAMRELVEKSYLSSVPQRADNDGGDWGISFDREMIYMRVGDQGDGRSRRVCEQAKRQLQMPNPTEVYKCDGSDYPGGSGKLPEREPCCLSVS